MIGYPSRDDWEDFYDESKREFRKSVEKSSVNRKNRIYACLPNISKNCADLLTRMLCWNPDKRIELS